MSSNDIELYNSTKTAINFNLTNTQYIYIASLLSATASISYNQLISKEYLNISKN